MTLYVLPHADDELFAVGLMAAESAQPQSLVWLTSGGWLPSLRRREQQRAARWLQSSFGVSCESLAFPDGQLAAHHDAAVRALRERRLTPSVVVTTDAEGRHADHDAAHRICLDAFPDAVVLTVPCYDRGLGRRRVGHPIDPTAPRWQVARVGAPLRRARLAIVRHYRSQWGVLLPLLAAGGSQFLEQQWWSSSDQTICARSRRPVEWRAPE